MSIIGKAIGSEKQELMYKESEVLVDNKTAIGVEVEIENCLYDSLPNSPRRIELNRFLNSGGELPDIRPFWFVVKDGSLRNGTEFVFSGPLEGANIVEALSRLSSFFEVYRYNNKGVVATDRCSVHVHMDVRDMDDVELTNLVLVYMLFEKVLFKLVEPSRLKNNYCRPLTDSSFKYIFSSMMNSRSYDDRLLGILQAVNSQCDKYSALNILPVTSKGSVEFRHYQGTTNPNELVDWINVLLKLKEISRSVDVTNIISQLRGEGKLKTLNSLFEGTILGTIEGVDDKLSSGINDVNELLNFKKFDNPNIPRTKSRPVNTLLYQYKVKNNLSVGSPSAQSLGA